jgi:molybdopterin synthase catalytic subunit
VTEPWVQIVDSPIDSANLLARVASPEAGAALVFVGVTRNQSDGRATQSLDYECYQDMALAKLRELACQAMADFSLNGCAVVHRQGHLEIGEASVAIAVSAPHREAAFTAGKWLIDRLKLEVPIWKRENWQDGTSTWVHPGVTR